MSDKVLFLDLETTGLLPQFCSILEVAAVVVDSQLVQHDKYEAVIFYPYDRINAEMNQWCLDTHTASGLLQEVERSPFDLKSVDDRLHHFIQKNFPDGQKVELGGNSVHFDLAFIKQHMPRTAGLLSHQLQDVSGAARLFRRFCGIDVPKPKSDVTHRAMADVQHSIEQVRLMREFVREVSQKMFEQGAAHGAVQGFVVGGRR